MHCHFSNFHACQTKLICIAGVEVGENTITNVTIYDCWIVRWSGLLICLQLYSVVSSSQYSVVFGIEYFWCYPAESGLAHWILEVSRWVWPLLCRWHSSSLSLKVNIWCLCNISHTGVRQIHNLKSTTSLIFPFSARLIHHLGENVARADPAGLDSGEHGPNKRNQGDRQCPGEGPGEDRSVHRRQTSDGRPGHYDPPGMCNLSYSSYIPQEVPLINTPLLCVF